MNESSQEELLLNMGSAKDKHGVRERSAIFFREELPFAEKGSLINRHIYIYTHILCIYIYIYIRIELTCLILESVQKWSISQSGNLWTHMTDEPLLNKIWKPTRVHDL